MIQAKAYSKTNSLVCSFECATARTETYATPDHTVHRTIVFYNENVEEVGRAYIETFTHPVPHDGYNSTISRKISISYGGEPYIRNITSLDIMDGCGNIWYY